MKMGKPHLPSDPVKHRRVTYNAAGIVQETEADKPLLLNGGKYKSDVDGALLISTDAAQQITERAIKRAIDQWSEAVKKDPSKDPNKRRRAHVPASNSGN